MRNGYKPKHVNTITKNKAPVKRDMLVRKISVLIALRNKYGSAIGAALNGVINAEEYLRLEQLSELH